MKHLILCPEFPPAPQPPGGIGTYVVNIAGLLADAGETVHVIGRLWEGASKEIEELHGGQLVIHRVPIDQPLLFPGKEAVQEVRTKEILGLAQWNFLPECFSWQASLLAESLVEQEGIDVIEAQEYQAPLYFFQLRRALGYGPKVHPPCFIHFHSPLEFIFRYNEWDTGRPDYLPTKRMEDYTIASADAWLCPSRYLARQVETKYGLSSNAVTVIPYPTGKMSVPERQFEVWENGTVCYVGRLEPRKGVIEWVEALLAVADEYLSVHFEFIGADLSYTKSLTMRRFLESRIPSRLKSRFHFRGSHSREKVAKFLAKAKIAVVPSRWENFPNTCIEAMGSGLPVIASKDGGMVELLRDGITGWLAHESGSKGLERALRRALETPPKELAAMGRSAYDEVRRFCDNTRVVEDQIAFRSRAVSKSATRSLSLPRNLSWADRPLDSHPGRQRIASRSDGGLAIVITCLEYEQELPHCLELIKKQSLKPSKVVLVVGNSQDEEFRTEIERARHNGWVVCETTSNSHSLAKNIGIETVLHQGQNPLGFVFLDSQDRLASTFTSECVSILQRCPNVGLLSPWTKFIGGDNCFFAYPCPAFPYQLIFNETVPATVVRTEALLEGGYFRDMLEEGYEMWDLVNAVMAAGWAGITLPSLLSERVLPTGPALFSSTVDDHHRMREEVIARFPDLVAKEAQTLILLLKSPFRPFPYTRSSGFDGETLTRLLLRPSDILQLPLRAQLKLAGTAFHNPRLALAFILWNTKRAVERAGTWFVRFVIR